MKSRILHSIVNLTENQDVDSLELSLLTSIIELIECRKAAIYELDVVEADQINTTLQVDVNTKDQGLQWRHDVKADDVRPELWNAIQQQQKIKIEDADGTVYFWVPVSGGGKQGCLYLDCQRLNYQQVELVEAIAKIYSNYLGILLESERDKLTGLLNRHSFDRRLKQILARQRREQTEAVVNGVPSRRETEQKSAWLVMVDIDHFKQVNDQFGHVCGDEVLLSLAQKMQSFFRKSDVMFRFGGEEFVLILAPSNNEDAFKKLDDFRAKIASEVFPLVDQVTISIGFTAVTDEYQLLLIERADKALYYAKEHGRNQVQSYEALVSAKKLKKAEAEQTDDIDLF